MTTRQWDPARLARLDEVLHAHVDAVAATGRVPGLAWVVARGDEVHAGAAGTLTIEGGDSVDRDTIFRIASMTKPITAVAALILVEECVLRLDDPVHDWLPELASPRVLADPDGALDDTVPAPRAITLRDLLTFRSGLGMDFTRFERQPTLAAAATIGLGAWPPAPAHAPPPDEYLRRIATLPLEYPPGERWLYHVPAEILGVLVARASGTTFDAFLRERVFDPLGMRDTAFFVPPESMTRFGAAYTARDDGLDLYDAPGGQWSTPPAFPGGGAGLVST